MISFERYVFFKLFIRTMKNCCAAAGNLQAADAVHNYAVLMSHIIATNVATLL